MKKIYKSAFFFFLFFSALANNICQCKKCNVESIQHKKILY
jgi:hypothetical protein